MSTKNLFVSIHGHISQKEHKRSITVKEMSKRLNCSTATYNKYLNGEVSPKSINNLMNLLSMMNEEDILKTLKDWKKEFKYDDQNISQKDKL